MQDVELDDLMKITWKNNSQKNKILNGIID